MLPAALPTSPWQNTLRVFLGLIMILAGLGHLTFLRTEFQAQVPGWVPLDKDHLVLFSGGVEMALGSALVFWHRKKIWVGVALALFFIAVFPGNLAQYLDRRDAFGLDTDAKRLARLFFQPVLILWALWSSGALRALRRDRTQGPA